MISTKPSDTAVGYLEIPHKVYKADSGGIKFRLLLSRSRHSSLLYLLNKECPHKPLYKIKLSRRGKLCDLLRKENVNFKLRDFNQPEFHDMWLTWYNDMICIGLADEPPFLKYKEDKKSANKQMIGFIKFITFYEFREVVQWDVFSSSDITIHRPMQLWKEIDDGKLRWVTSVEGCPLPRDAMIGGFEDEPLYIARVSQEGSLTPGKYSKSDQCAYITWENREITKAKFEILCGYDAMWQKCVSDQIPENAFIAGRSKDVKEPLYIGRAQVKNYLIPGKVQASSKKCSISYRGKELLMPVYDILVTTYKPLHGDSTDLLCFTKMNMEPCI